jgi:hypothetical protein
VRDDCRAVNLEFCTPKQNIAHQLLSKFIKWEPKPSPEHHLSTCPYCLHEFEGLYCPRCSCRQSSPGDNYRRSAGGGFF